MKVIVVVGSIAISSLALRALPPEKYVGVDANYSLKMEGEGKTWNAGGEKKDLFALLKESGCNSLRLRVWTGDEGVNGLRYALRLARRAQESGLKPYVVLFLSED